MKRSSSFRKSSIPLPNRKVGSLSTTPRRVLLESGGRLSMVRTPKLGHQKLFAPTSSAQSIRSVSSVRSTKGKNVFPTSDPDFKKQQVVMIEKFLLETAYGGEFSRKVLMKPTAKQFLGVFSFVMEKIDFRFVAEPKFEEQIPKLVKSLGYPVTLTKSAFLTIGSPHSWPSVLGMLSWLVSVAEACEGEPEGSPYGVESLMDMYACPENQTEILEELRTSLFEVHNLSNEEMTNLKSEHETLSADENHLKERIEAQTQKLSSFSATFKAMAEDEDKMAKYISDLSKKIDNQKQQYSNLQDQLDEVKDRSKEHELEMGNLKEKIASQRYTEEQVKNIKEHAENAKATIKSMHQEIEELREEIENHNRTISKNDKESREKLLKNNARLRRFGLEEEARNCETGELDVVAAASGKLRDQAAEISENVKACKYKKAEFESEMPRQKNEVFKLDCKMKRIEEEIKAIKEEIPTLQNYRCDEIRNEEQLATQQDKQIKELKNEERSLEQRRDALKKEVEEYKIGFEKFKRENEQKRAKKEAELCSALEKFHNAKSDHEKYKREKLAQFRADLEGLRKEQSKRVTEVGERCRKLVEEHKRKNT